MISDSNGKPVTGKAKEWFEGLRELTRDEAIALLKNGDTVTMAIGTPRLFRVTREQAITMIEAGARAAPTGQPRSYSGHNIAVIDPEYGFPVQLQTKSIADMLAQPVPEGYVDNIDFEPPRMNGEIFKPVDLGE